MTYQEGLNYITDRRQVANPNMTFMAQLIQFYKRLYENRFESIPTSPRVFVICSHEQEDPWRIVPKMLMENLYQGKNSKKLDPRGAFIIQGEKDMKVWLGS